MSRMDEILAYKRLELPKRMQTKPLSLVQAEAQASQQPLDTLAALRKPAKARPRLIAEVKAASPSRGVLVKNFDPLALAQVYCEYGAAAISVLTDEHFFRGRLEYLSQISAMQPRPVTLRKDFILDEYQLYEARAAGASMALLIVAALTASQLVSLREKCESLGMTALVEAHTAEEVHIALNCGAKLLGINNRDLGTFQVNLETSLRLRALIPPEVVVVAESGIFTRADVDRLADAGVDAILVGEALVTAPDIAAKVRELAGTA
jgi:indole-3-glycerol phosphate synthase